MSRFALLALAFFSCQPAYAVDGISQSFDIEFSYEEGWDVTGTAAFATASAAHNIVLSSPSGCQFMFVHDDPPDGRISEQYPEANFAFCADPGQDVIGRIDFPIPLRSFSSEIPYFAGGVVTFEAFSAVDAKLFEMQDTNNVGFDFDDVGQVPVAYVIFSGNQMDAAINIDNLRLQTIGDLAVSFQAGDQPVSIDAAGYEEIINHGMESTVYWTPGAEDGTLGRTLFSLQPAANPDTAALQESTVRYPVVFVTAGEYYIYVRARTRAELVDAPDPGIWINAQLDETLPSAERGITPNTVYRWRRAGPITVAPGDLDALRNIRVGLKSDGVSLDEILLSTDGLLSHEALDALYAGRGIHPARLDPAAGEFDWTQLGGNRRMSGHSEVVGQLDTVPVIRGTAEFGFRETLLSIDLDQPGPQSVTAFDEEVYLDHDDYLNLHSDWRFGDPVFERTPGGDRELFYINSHEKRGHFLGVYPGLQRVWVDSGAQTAHYEHWSSGDWQEIWSFYDDAWSNVVEPIVGDFDNDGDQEMAFLPWRDVWVRDLATGDVEQVAQFIPDESDNGRPYGWFGAIDMFEDARSEFLVIGTFHNHMEVLGWNAMGELEKRWDWLVENGISNKQTIIHSGVNPVGDVVSGNGVAEIVVSVFNAGADGQWHTLIMNALTGAVLFDLEDLYISRLFDINNDGFEDLMLTPTTGRLIREDSGVSIRTYNSGSETILFSTPGGGFADYYMQNFPDHNISNTGHFRRTAFVADFDSGYPVFSTWDLARTELSLWRFSGETTPNLLGTVSGPNLEPAGWDAPDLQAGEILLWARSHDTGELVEADFDMTVEITQRNQQGQDHQPVVGPLASNANPAIIVDIGLGVVQALSWEQGSLSPEWTIAGRSAHPNSHSERGLLLANVAGDASFELLVAGKNGDGSASMTASRNGSAIWSVGFDGFQGDIPDWNQNGLLTWHAGRFDSDDHEDVFVTLRRSTMHSDEKHLLSGMDGSEQWVRTSMFTSSVEPPKGRGAGGTASAVFDANLDGREDFVVTAPQGVGLLNGHDGSSLFEVHNDQLPCCLSFETGTLPMRDAYGMQYLVSHDGYGGIAQFHLNGALQWVVGSGESGFSRGVLADLNGDGREDLVVIGDDYGSSITAYDIQGTKRWTFPASPDGQYGASADIDNDGHDEVLYVEGADLVAIEENGGLPAEKWRWSEPGNWIISGPALADVDRDGALDLLVRAGPHIHVLGNAGPAPPPGAPDIQLASSRFESGLLRIPWQYAGFARRYTVSIATDPAMSGVIRQQIVPRHQSHLVTALEPGNYWVRVEATNPQGTALSAIHPLVISPAPTPLHVIFGDGFENP